MEATTKTPNIDVIIPAFNMEKYIAVAIKSVLQQKQYVKNIFVIDDGSTDNTAKIINKYTKKYSVIRYMYQKNKGLSAARNAGIKKSQAEYIAFLDADDTWRSDKLKKQLETFKKTTFKNLGLVYTGYSDIDQNGKVIKNMGGFQLDKRVRGDVSTFMKELNYASGSGSAVLVKGECFRKAGLFDESLDACEDWDMWLRIAEAGYQFDYVEEKLVALRRRNDSMQKDIKRMIINTIKFFRKRPKTYQIPKIHLEYLRRQIIGMMLQGPKNIPFLMQLKVIAGKKINQQIWPNKMETIKAVSWVVYAKANNIIKALKS